MYNCSIAAACMYVENIMAKIRQIGKANKEVDEATRYQHVQYCTTTRQKQLARSHYSNTVDNN